MNSVNLTGRITHDLELQTNGSTTWVNFQIAVANPSDKEKDYFIKCVAFGKTAEILDNHSGKGKMVGVEGRLETSTIEDNGVKKHFYSVVCNRVDILEWASKKKAEKAILEPEGGHSPEDVYGKVNPPIVSPEVFNAIWNDVDDDEIPF